MCYTLIEIEERQVFAMIRRYDYGSPIETGAIPCPPPAQKDTMPYFSLHRAGASLSFSLPLSKDMFIFGLGETVRGINKRGHLYRSWNSDDGAHSEDKHALYASHNFLIFWDCAQLLGVFFDDPGFVEFDLGYSHANEAVITSKNGDLRVYLIEEESLLAVTRAFRKLIGRSYLPPKWAFGYLQSRWGYASEQDVLNVVREHRSRDIPLDGVCMDIDYMDGYRDFTVDTSRFPDLAALAATLHDEHIQLIPIIDAGIKQEEGYRICDEGLANNYFCTQENGQPFVGAVWPGRSYFPDFLKEDVRAWFGAQYASFLDAGIEGFWNDMNEPALFYSPSGLAAAIDEAEALRGKNVGIEDFFRIRRVFDQLAGNPNDYACMYQCVGGHRIRHDRVHNLYGMNMTRAASEGMHRHAPSRRHLLFTRSSYIGAHRYGGVWQGDNASWWSHLLLNLKMMPSLNMCGFLYTGADIGGFNCDTTEDLLLRWLQLGIFTPLMRNHASYDARNQEIYRFDSWQAMRNVVTLRYALLPFLYSEFMKCALTDACMFRPLAFDYPQDPTACRIEDQVMLGEACMIAPVYEQNARGRHVYLPEDMLMLRMRSAGDYDRVPMAKGHHWLELELDECPLFIRRGHVIPWAHAAQWVDAVDSKNLALQGWLDDQAIYALYDDDGYAPDVELSKGLTLIHVHRTKDGVCATGDGLTLNTKLIVCDEAAP